MEATDAELMASLAAGEDLALNALMARWSERVIAFLFRMTGRRETAVDLAQETFVKLYQARGNYRPQGAFSTYLLAFAVNLARNHARWQARHPTVFPERRRAG
jgi:RNA polymerase sigma-70 factor (ECF subfamily)